MLCYNALFSHYRGFALERKLTRGWKRFNKSFQVLGYSTGREWDLRLVSEIDCEAVISNEAFMVEIKSTTQRTGQIQNLMKKWLLQSFIGGSDYLIVGYCDGFDVKDIQIFDVAKEIRVRRFSWEHVSVCSISLLLQKYSDFCDLLTNGMSFVLQLFDFIVGNTVDSR